MIRFKKRNPEKPAVWGILWLTLLLALCILCVYRTAGNSFRFEVPWDKNFYGEPHFRPEMEDAPLELESMHSENGRLIIDVRAVPNEAHPAFRADETYGIFVESKEEDRSATHFRTLSITPSGVIVDSTTGRFSGSNEVTILIALYLLGVAAILFFAFRKQLRYSMFSYNTVIYLGFGIFVFLLFLMFQLFMVWIVHNPLGVNMLVLYQVLKHSATYYLLLLAPLLILFALALLVSNLWLIRREGWKRPTNYFAAILALAILVGEAVLLWEQLYTLDHTMEGWQEVVYNAFSAVFLYFECMLAGMAGAYFIAGSHVPARNKDYLMILGCAMRKDGTPTPLLAGRCNAAVNFYKRQIAEGGKPPVIICSGGQGGNEPVSEALSMKNYLLTQGIPEEHIRMEEKSANTWQNFRFSNEIIADDTAKTAFFTTKYHVFRSGIWARRAGMPRSIEGGGAKTKWYFWPNALTREFVGLLSAHRLKQGLLLLGTIALYVILALVF